MIIQNFVICDFLRRDDGGKFMCIGIYENSLVPPRVPIKLPLWIMMQVSHEALGEDTLQIRGRLSTNADAFFLHRVGTQVNDLSSWSTYAFSITVPVTGSVECPRFTGQVG